LTLDRSCLERGDLEGAKFVCSPPLRERQDQEALWRAIASGVITVIGSDQCSFHSTDKIEGAKRGFPAIPNGLPMIEDQFSVMYHYGVAEGRISMQQFVAIMSTNAAKQFGMYPRKGALQVGSDGDVVVLDPKGSRIVRRDKQLLKVDYNVYEGLEVKGVIRHVLSRGELIASNGAYVGSPSRGRFIHRDRSAGRKSDL
jgi:dihydropyrimidinase